MKNLIVILLLLIVTIDAVAQVKLRFASKEEAMEMIVEDDAYTNGWGSFDLDCRAGHKDATKSEVLKMMQDNCLEYSDEEKDILAKCMSMIEDTLKSYGWTVPMPEEIVFVKTTMKEEGGAGGYTRKNRIYLSGANSTHWRSVRLVAHELFHVLTRNDAEFRRKMYSVIGFNVLDHEFEFAKDILDKRISNPDVSRYDSYAELTIGDTKRPCTMMFYSDREYDGGSFFTYSKIGLIPLDDELKPIVRNGMTEIHPLEECSDFYDLVGNNTRYVINPEECLADNFAALIVLSYMIEHVEPNNRIYNGVRKVLKGE